MQLSCHAFRHGQAYRVYSCLLYTSPAAQAGAKAGDEILAVDGTPVTALDAVSPILSRKKVGERVTLKVKRKDKRLSYTITLGSRRQALGGNAPEDSNDLISGGFSKRRDDFPMVLQHDTPSRYTLMGGPLLNLKGELIGMNIARVNRAENYADVYKRQNISLQCCWPFWGRPGPWPRFT